MVRRRRRRRSAKKKSFLRWFCWVGESV